jgi:hypothetical protein
LPVEKRDGEADATIDHQPKGSRHRQPSTTRPAKQPCSGVRAGRRLMGPVEVPCQGFREFRLPGRARLPTNRRMRPCAAHGRGSPASGGEPRDLEKLVGQIELQLFPIRVRNRIE